MPLRIVCLLSVMLSVLLGAALPATAGMDAPGQMSFDFLAEEDSVYHDRSELPAEAPFAEGWAEAFFSSDASEFGQDGAFVWGGLDLSGPDGPRYGILLMDLNLAAAPLDGSPMPHRAVRAEYLEKRGNDLLFSGSAVTGDVSIIDLLFHPGDDGAVEGRFEFFFVDPDGLHSGCRVLLDGVFSTDPSPTRMREIHHLPPVESDGSNVYVGIDCSGAIYAADEGDGGCGGEDASGCEGDTTDDGAGCEGDGSASSDCSGDGEAAGSCEGDTAGGGDCGDCGSASASTIATPGAHRARSGGPLRGLMRFFPEIVTLLFIGAWRRRR